MFLGVNIDGTFTDLALNMGTIDAATTEKFKAWTP